MSIRSDIADAMRELLPETFVAMPYAKALDNTSVPVIMVHRSKVTRNEAHSYWDHAVTVHVLVPETIGEAAEDAADAALDAALGVLDLLPNLDWTEAERASYANFTGYEITLSATLKHSLGD